MSHHYRRTPDVMNRPKVRSIKGDLNQLGVWRLRAGLSQAVLGGLLRRDAPFVSKMERRPPERLAPAPLSRPYAAGCGAARRPRCIPGAGGVRDRAACWR